MIASDEALQAVSLPIRIGVLILKACMLHNVETSCVTLSAADTAVLQECHESAPAGCWDDVIVVGPTSAFRSMFNVMWNTDTQLYEAFPEHEKLLQWLLPNLA